eukprot:14174052-Alexandrium_andersonii.AAC.1
MTGWVGDPFRPPLWGWGDDSSTASVCRCGLCGLRGYAPQHVGGAPLSPRAERLLSSCRAGQATGLLQPLYTGDGVGRYGLCHATGGLAESVPMGLPPWQGPRFAGSRGQSGHVGLH